MKGWCHLKHTNLKNNKDFLQRHFLVYRKLIYNLLKIRKLFFSVKRSKSFVKKTKKAINLKHKAHTKRKLKYFKPTKQAQQLFSRNHFQLAWATKKKFKIKEYFQNYEINSTLRWSVIHKMFVKRYINNSKQYKGYNLIWKRIIKKVWTKLNPSRFKTMLLNKTKPASLDLVVTNHSYKLAIKDIKQITNLIAKTKPFIIWKRLKPIMTKLQKYQYVRANKNTMLAVYNKPKNQKMAQNYKILNYKKNLLFYRQGFNNLCQPTTMLGGKKNLIKTHVGFNKLKKKNLRKFFLKKNKKIIPYLYLKPKIRFRFKKRLYNRTPLIHSANKNVFDLARFNNESDNFFFQKFDKQNRIFFEKNYVLDLKKFKKLYSIWYILNRHIKNDYRNQLNTRIILRDFSRRRLKKNYAGPWRARYLRWIQPLISKKWFIPLNRWNTNLRKRPIFKSKKNKIYYYFKLFLKPRYKPIRFIAYKPSGNRYIRAQVNFAKSLRPAYGKLNKKRINRLWGKLIRIKSKYYPRNARFFQLFDLTLYSVIQLLNWVPNTLWANWIIKNRWVYVSQINVKKPTWYKQYNFPLSKNLNTLDFNYYKNLQQKRFQKLTRNEIIQINPKIKKYISKLFTPGTMLNKKPVMKNFDLNSTGTSAILNTFAAKSPAAFQHRITKTKFRYIKD